MGKLGGIQNIRDGFQINWMNMSSEGKELWKEDFHKTKVFGKKIIVQLPKEILNKKHISREINFSSKEIIKHLRLRQQIKLHGNTSKYSRLMVIIVPILTEKFEVENWLFDFGFVIPGSTNTWQNTIDAGQNVIPAAILSGNVTIETTFCDGNELIGTCDALVYYI
jgi:retinal rod rhodopsin-sensitive cGMP 3',5'-cyclic phosphodiesterase subunit delta